MAIDTPVARIGVRSERLTGRIGAVLADIDLRHVDEGTVAGIRQAILAHRVVFFRDQQLDAAGQIAFAASSARSPTPTDASAQTEDPNLRPRLARRASAAHWHTDVTFVEQPPTFSVLRAVVIPKSVATHSGPTPWPPTVTCLPCSANSPSRFAPCTPTVRITDESTSLR